jgi:TolA-binding protein
MQAHIEISREAATQSAEDLQSKLLQSTKRQEEMIGQGYSLAHECFALTQQMLAKATEIFTSNRAIESHEKILISSLPAYMRAASDMVKAVSDTEDKLFALEEISKRLDQWQQLQMQNDQN